ncbi:MAG: glycine cleavage system protein GcvH [Chloroflexi bacterium]|nr:glycine cleavage system protein GcvH [Chloroflexota bacterium]MDA1219759.1 glycine cleavage system protein GcvH [Chloroflexota bacterium]
MNPADRKYTKEHEWIKVEDAATNRALVGITEYAQDQLGDVVYFDLPQAGASVSAMQKMGEVESVKAVSDLFSPVSGQVIEINGDLIDHPELVNEDPFEKGWIMRVTMNDASEVDGLMSAEDYEAYIGGL